MFARWNFYLGYAVRNMRRSARWTIFAIFCIAAGVATVVSLRGLGLAIGDTLIDNARYSLHGDITIATDGSGGTIFPGGSDTEDDVFFPRVVESAQRWADENGAQVTFYYRTGNLQVTAVEGTTVGRPQFINTILVDPTTFSPAGEVFASDPAGVPLRDLLPGGREIVISSNLAEGQGLQVGDTVRVSNTTEIFTVTGIVPAELEASITNPIASFFGFVYMHRAQAETVQMPTDPNVITFGLPATIAPEDAEAQLRRAGVAGFTTTLPELLETYKTVSDTLGRFIVVMGLGALLIGGVGIINTMLAVVARRTNEIAALKTFGLTGRQIIAVFMTESLLLGLIGSAVGAVAGVLLSVFVNQYGELFLQQRLVWRVYPEAILLGAALGIVVTLVFGILPVLTANRIRPAIILRPDETHIPAVGALQSLIALLLIVFVIGGAAGQILGSIPIGIIGVAITLVILGILTGIMWLVVWLVGRFPSFGVVDLQLALRNMRARRVRTATTLLALAAGMFALSSITFVGVGTREILNFQLTQNFGGNVLVIPGISLLAPALAESMLDARVATIEGVEYSTKYSSFSATIETVNGEPYEVSFPFSDEVPARARSAMRRVVLQSRESTNPDLSSGRLIAGRDLTQADRGQPVMVIAASPIAGMDTLSTVPVGAQVEIRYGSGGTGGQRQTFEVVGIVESSGFGFGQVYIPPGVAPSSGLPDLFIYQVEPEHLNEALLAFSELPFVLTLDLSFIDGLLSRLIAQFSAIPTIVGLLSLLAAAVAMANTVSLATLERRRQIGILKAIGAGTRRVLGVMLLENTIVGLLGGLIGIGVSALGVALMTLMGVGDAIPIPREAVPTAILLVTAAVVIAVIATLLSAQVAVRERVVDVLRYE
ncbi:MAG: ABC transporter permease [Anaerolineae bacterium]|nr:ABC transporter permease [Anaerolineae bacterium]